jgi:DNA-binding response OmpR family regulator
MPVLSGISLVEKIRAEPALADLPVVVITSGGERERERLASLGVARFLRKPVTYEDVAGAIRGLLETRGAAAGVRTTAAAAGSSVPGGGDARQGLTTGSAVVKDPSDAMPASRR